MKRCLAFFLLVLSSVVPLGHLDAARAYGSQQYREVRHVMGTLLDITLYHDDRGEARKSLDHAFAVAQRLDNLLSNYKPESEVSRLNQRAGQGRVRVSPDLYRFLVLAKSSWERTEGAFDVTVGPLMRLWKKAYEKGEMPSGESIEAAKLLVGARHIILHSNFEVELAPAGVKIDTGGIGKGYAVDRIVELFRNEKITRALINFGHSSIYALGAPPQAQAWKLSLQFPGKPPLGILELKDQALSASDSFGSHFVIAGKTYGHIVDPKTGSPVAARIQAAVLSRSAAHTETLSKYVILRGWTKEDDARELGKVQILRVGEGGEIFRSENFPLKPSN